VDNTAAATATIEGIAVVPPGLEGLAAEELAALGAQAVTPLRRAVSFRTDLAGYYRLHLGARLPFRLLRELARFPCRGRDDLHAGVQAAADWATWLPPQVSFRVDASGSAPGLNHSHYSALQVKNALTDWQRQHWGERSSVNLEDPDLVFHLHLSSGGRGGRPGDGEAVLSLDGSAGSLHRRGYRGAMGLAPLKENLAAGLIALTGWDGRVPLADPLCGSGTLLIEAACRALGRAPGLRFDGPGPPRPRAFGFLGWPDFEAGIWQREVEAAAARARCALPDGTALAPLVGMEREPAVVEQARANAAAAGVSPWLELRSGDFRDFQPPPGPGLLVCNPPYGARLGAGGNLEALYSDLGTMAKERCSGWTLWLLSGNPELTGALRMRASRRIPVSNGGIDCRWLRYDLR
jgi:putative N6-adenine-specific DNA methylase